MSETLKIQELDPLFKEEVAREPGCSHLLRCFACGVCTATCPVAEVEPEFSPSRIIRQILYGMKERLLTSAALWHCARCARCSFTCPQDVRFLDVVQGLRNLAVRQGYVNPKVAERLARGEQLLQELRHHFLTVLLSAPEEGLDVKAALQGVLNKLDIPSTKED
ncbi:MAG: 4Fe-4S dicluster domain-containing protein [Desulfobaccales bacterium]